jgi:hypothetical protein
VPGDATTWGPRVCVAFSDAAAAYASIEKLKGYARLLDRVAVKTESDRASEALLALGAVIGTLPDWSPGTSTNLELDTAWKDWSEGVTQMAVGVPAKDVSAVTDAIDQLDHGSMLFKEGVDTFVGLLQSNPSLHDCSTTP